MRIIFRSSRPGVFLENFTKFTGKFSCEFCEIFKNIFFTEQLWVTAPVFPYMEQTYGHHYHAILL